MRKKTFFIIPIFLVIFGLLFFYNNLYFGQDDYFKALQNKLKDTDYSRKEITDLKNYFKKSGFSIEDIQRMDSVKTNASGQTYGPDAFRPDLISVVCPDSTSGYIYRTEFLNFTENKSEQSSDDNSLPVYESDGETLIGYFNFSYEN